MADLRSLVRQRASLKSRVTIFGSFLEQITPASEEETLSNAEHSELVKRLQKFESIENEFHTAQGRIEEIADEADLERQFEERANFESSYYAAFAKAAVLIAQYNEEYLDNASEVHSNPSHHSDRVLHSALNRSTHSISSNADNPSNRLKLPTIKLLPFSGSYDDWLEFRETYQSLIHNRDNIETIEKFHYLRSTLQGDAAQVIKAIEFTASNYERAWQLLCDRYNNERLLINNHVKALFNIEPMIKESSSQIRNLIDHINKHLQALKSLNQPTESWDTLIIHLSTGKLDPTTVREWEEFKVSKEVPNFAEFKQFLKGRADLLETLEARLQRDTVKPKNKPVNTRSFHTSVNQCVICNANHQVYNCDKLTALTAEERLIRIKELKLCANCLKPGHFANVCKAGACRRCGRRHNTLLHFEEAADSQKPAALSATLPSENVGQVSMHASNHVFYLPAYTLLATALVDVVNKYGATIQCRVLLDNGSQSNLVTEDLCKRLGIDMKEISMNIYGVGGVGLEIKHQTTIKINSRTSKFSLELSCLVVPKIGGNMPAIPLDLRSLPMPPNIILADPNFSTPNVVDILIGAEHFFQLLAIGQKSLGPNLPILQKTLLGWIVTGPIPLPPEQSHYVQCNLAQIELENTIKKFWEVEEFVNSKPLSGEEIECEKIFQETTTRRTNGQFIVRLPLKHDVSLLGNTEAAARRRLFGIETKFTQNPELESEYKEFMLEYERLGHMSKIDLVNPEQIRYFIPHHAVLKNDSLTTKCRVVYDASAKSSSGFSLNNLLMVGPTIQDDLVAIILRFRTHKIALTADVEKMYRQVLIATDQYQLQTILWRENEKQAIQTYELNTVTYGTASAAYLAVRALQQTAHDYATIFPRSSKAVLSDFYVDDFLSGAESVEEAQQLKYETSSILSSGGFTLRKWASNDPSVFDGCNASALSILKIGKNERTKTLGLLWNPHEDTFEFSIQTEDTKRFTKRKILSSIAQIFDPLGLLGPVIIAAKIFMQKIWETKAEWDESLPIRIHHDWVTFYNELPHLNHIKIHRKILIDHCVRIELHGFADASTLAYGACIYVRSLDDLGNVLVTLLCAKSKVAPLKPLTVPRLELCGALLLTRLLHKVVESLNLNVDEISCWVDSTIVLGQLKKNPNIFQTFVSNRVAEIQRLSESYTWRHVQTTENPGDLVSRGLTPSQLVNSQLWFNGPPWLSSTILVLDDTYAECDNLPEVKKQTHVLTCTTDLEFPPFQRCSQLRRLLHTTAYCLRFIHHKSNRGQLTFDEIQNALTFVLKLSQRQSFSEEYEALIHKRSISHKSKLMKLTPILDSNNLMRVGGRLSNSNFNFNKKHPIIIDAHHPMAKLIFRSEHERLLHAGAQLLLASIRDTYWPVLGRNLAKKVVFECIRCFRLKPKHLQPPMGNLPKARVTASFPFHATGVDYAGPFTVKDRKGRGSKTSKYYLALFVCFTTKCVHLELVTSLSAESFILALRRFIARRGRPAQIFSDNGTNFVGANSSLNDLGEFLKLNQESLQSAFVHENINWHFIPAHSPHFGGLWEAGVKSAKAHLKRVAGDQNYTFEELSTLIAQIEAVLNSRPLSPLSADPDDDTPLTPSHFLLGRSATALPDIPGLEGIPDNRLNIFQRIEKAKQDFWKRWSIEYVSELQQKVKWRSGSANPSIGTLVLIKDNQTPSLKWSLGRITELHVGSDGVCRVVTVKTSKGLLKRSVVNICPLPIEVDDLKGTPFKAGGMLGIGLIASSSLPVPEVGTTNHTSASSPASARGECDASC